MTFTDHPQPSQESHFSTRLISTEPISFQTIPDGLPDNLKTVTQMIAQKGRINEEINIRFWNLLVKNVPKSGFIPPKNRPTEVLNIACGDCDEGFVVSAFFGGNNYGSVSNNVNSQVLI